ncbi:MAG: protein-glutamate O-methyltransferase CheR [Oscillospiraceae bacterium]|nr:protein-glutamate O-methyltransferase CheR [Oscillospiraceae bacterium]
MAFGDNTLSAAEYKKIQDFIYLKIGTDADEKKKETVTTKIIKLMHRHGMSKPQEYVNFILNATDPDDVQEFLNEITTNTTSFFRENEHFLFIKNNISEILAENPRIKRSREIRVWSAPCSSGEEPITLAIILKECLPPDIKIKILATDISEKVLKKAQRGVYSESECKGLSKQHMLSYFKKQPDGFYAVDPELKRLITYRRFNFTDDFKIIKRNFDIIFCRNVMIYMDNETQEKLVNKFYDVIVPNGLFFIGHSESLISKKHNFKQVRTAVFKK